MRARVALVVAFWVVGCRDEQAGPKSRVAAQPSAGAAQTSELPADLTHRSGETWLGGAVTYLGSKVEPPNPQPGQQVLLRHFFTASRAVPTGFRFFVHVIDADTSAMLANIDHEIQGGAAPLGTWPLGKVIEDAQRIQMPQYPGTLRLALGFWNDQGRLPPDAPRGPEGTILGPTLEGPKLPPLPEYLAPRATKPPAIDGKLDDEVWKRAPVVTLTTSFDGHEAKRKTRMRVLWDDATLYVAFDCDDPDVWGTLKKKDDPIYNEEVVEVFIDADGDGATYNELQVSPHNVNFDASFVARRSDLEAAMKWESGMTTAVQVRGTLDDASDADQGWSAEMRIPLANLNSVPKLPPTPGTKWRFNAYRLEHFQHGTQIEGQSFSPLFVGDFHALPRFGWLVFGG